MLVFQRCQVPPVFQAPISETKRQEGPQGWSRGLAWLGPAERPLAPGSTIGQDVGAGLILSGLGSDMCPRVQPGLAHWTAPWRQTVRGLGVTLF